jgi:hypothetical protein
MKRSLRSIRVLLGKNKSLNKNTKYRKLRVSFLLKILVDFKVQRPSWEANSHSARQEIPRHLTPKVCYRVYKNRPQISLLRHRPMTPLWALLPLTPRSSKWSLPFRFLKQNFGYTSCFPMHATCHFYLILLDLIILITYGSVYMFLFICYLFYNALSVTKIIQRRLKGRWVNDEFERICKQAVVA